MRAGCRRPRGVSEHRRAECEPPGPEHGSRAHAQVTLVASASQESRTSSGRDSTNLPSADDGQRFGYQTQEGEFLIWSSGHDPNDEGDEARMGAARLQHVP
jgi:hypothetical protein